MRLPTAEERIRAQLAAARRRKIEYQNKLTDDHGNLVDVKNHIRLLKQQLAVELAKPSYPPAPTFSTFTFAIQFNDGGITYHYAAKFIGGRVYITGQSMAYTWTEFIDWLRDPKKRAVSALRPVVDASSPGDIHVR